MKVKASKTVTLSKMDIEKAIGEFFDQEKFSGHWDCLNHRDRITHIEWTKCGEAPVAVLTIEEAIDDPQ
tara:strand:- start:145 stop:351 length:207 start_codon:yes stop_codon:yes gene_type:complete